MRADTLKSIVGKFSVLLELWDESLENVRETEMKGRIQGVSAQMKKFFGVSLGLVILRHTDDLSKNMQKADMSAKGQELNSIHFEVTA